MEMQQSVKSGDEGSSGAYVCPSDRQLALRAKLQTGWSMNKQAKAIKPEEHAAIVKVIRRNEVLEAFERQRVGRLVERVEKIKQRAAEYGPNHCRLCGKFFGLLGPVKLTCIDCNQHVCTKCAIDLNHRANGKSAAKETWLCKICSETREMWKKSGAWFYKGIPQYELPAQPQRNIRQINCFRDMRARPSTSGSVKVKKSHGMSVNDSSSEEDEEELDGDQLAAREDGFNLQRNMSFKSVSGNFNTSLTDVNKYDQISTSSFNMERNASIRRKSVSSLYSVSEATVSGQKGLPAYREPPLGWLEVALHYDEKLQTFTCAILRARDLTQMDANGLADPFCKMNIIAADGRLKLAKWLQTKTIHKTTNPEFNETKEFQDVLYSELDTSFLYITMFDDDKFGCDFMGSAKINLLQAHLSDTYRITVALQPEDKFCIDASYSNYAEDPRGQILTSLCYNTKKRALIVIIKRCINLISKDKNGFSDPFMKLHLTPDGHKKKCKTSIKWRNLNPVYNEEFAFETRPNDFNKQSLVITVWDKDIGKSNDFLGSLILGPTSKGKRLKQWKDCVRLPDAFHEQWHILSAELPTI